MTLSILSFHNLTAFGDRRLAKRLRADNGWDRRPVGRKGPPILGVRISRKNESEDNFKHVEHESLTGAH